MHIKDLCYLKWQLSDCQTYPLLIPSFSSRGFPSIGKIHSSLSTYLSQATLISAYDIYYNYLDIENIYISDLLIIDSGGYEAKLVQDPLEAYFDDRKAKIWNEEFYTSVLKSIEPLSDIIIVSYDSEPAPLDIQFEKADKLFGQFKLFSNDFLLKPEPGSKIFCDLRSLSPYVEYIRNFNWFGITDKELGTSLFERCQSLIGLRSFLSLEKCAIPIHIFGCLDPINIIIYFLCGVDIFDGLSWLRYNYLKNRANYLAQSAFYSGNYTMSDDEILGLTWVTNIEFIEKLQSRLHEYLKDYNPDHLELSENERLLLSKLFNKLNISTEGAL
jgi:hypothetical protein